MKKIIVACLCLFSLSAFSQRTVDKNVGDFDKIKVFDLIEVNLIKSDENKVLIKGWNVDDIQVVNKNGVLKIRMQLDRKFQGEHTFVEVHYKKLNVIDGNEGARIVFNETVKQDIIELRTQEGAKIVAGLDVDFVDIRAVTGGIVEASGLASEQQVVLNTGGVYEGRELITEFSKVKITAAGEAEVYAADQIDINVKAGGDVYVYGDPKIVNKSTLAGGRIYIKD
ncbi:hypothetical protein GGR42_001290 [Saonia flava]|uniref:Putative auto-transporter adhesin head GIN domain-containing protein n=1 Tax=Saonia flava TaxID=523696 RepID=A0A846QRX3_9FLAO|nr:head GIN domain-containing protein [Saonia flava]NJB70828.1 hypothetical protein [Saonia flava]